MTIKLKHLIWSISLLAGSTVLLVVVRFIVVPESRPVSFGGTTRDTIAAAAAAPPSSRYNPEPEAIGQVISVSLSSSSGENEVHDTPSPNEPNTQQKPNRNKQ